MIQGGYAGAPREEMEPERVYLTATVAGQPEVEYAYG